nr:malto-oligosyltrehalose synthase [Planctomycetota bacterium]
MTGAPAPAPARIATYRLQFTPQFRFRDALALLPYLRDLGISHIYASPITQARTGSTHGYDVCDPRAVNPELGTRDELFALLRAVRAHGLGWLQDVVPNHLAVSAQNPYLWDVLAWGRRSRWAFLFDIDWDHPDLGGKLLLPQLGEPYVDSLRAGKLRLRWRERGPVLVYGGLELPLTGASVAALLDAAGLAPGISQALAESDGLIPAEARERLRAEALEMAVEPALRAELERVLAEVTDPLALDAVIVQQAWQLAWWRMGREQVGYRRFFAIDELIAVRMEDPRTFNLMHALACELVDSGLVDGLRIDHVDGLIDPTAYLRGLRARLPDAWLVVEKILGRDEELPVQWPIDGTTGYELLAGMTAACCAPASAARFGALHRRLTGSHVEPARLAGDLR